MNVPDNHDEKPDYIDSDVKRSGSKKVDKAKRAKSAAEPKAKKDKAAKPDKPKEIPLWKLDRGKWQGGTTAQRIQRIRWMLIALWRTAPYWLVVLILIALFGPMIFRPRVINQPIQSPIAPFFTREVQHWAGDIVRWAQQYGADPNLLATLMQIESCGLPLAKSTVGAQGLFQVMPLHFAEGEVMTDPDTNARRGVGVIQECLGYSSGDPGLAMACYNGGPSLIYRAFSNWPTESQNYYTWGSGIYGDATSGRSTSDTLDNWLASGGIYLCQEAAVALNLPTLTPGPVIPRPTSLPTVAVAPPVQQSTSVASPGAPPGGIPTFAIETPTPSPAQ